MTDGLPQPQARSLKHLAAALSPASTRIFGLDSTLVAHITEDSRRVQGSSLFVARAGEKVDGRRFIADAKRAGAAAILCEVGAGITAEPRLEVDDLRHAWGVCAQSLYGDPSREVGMIGITGTNGKTTVASLVAQALSFLGVSAGRLGTLGFFIDSSRLGDSLTTPQPDQLALNLAQCRDRGARYLVAEVSSHALHQDRVAGVQFLAAALTNLTQDHLDYHQTMEAYGEAKARLFRECNPRHRIINIDDPFGAHLSAEFKECITVSARGNTQARFWVENCHFGHQGVEAQVVTPQGSYPFESRLLGRHNLENVMVALGLLCCLDVAPVQALAALSGAQGVAGRMERCDESDDEVVVVVDYAHTPDALERALSSLRDLDFVGVHCVFGCGGDRDKKKRAPMGEVATRLSERAYLTSDNPRTEDPLKILRDVEEGFGAGADTIVEVDRRRAIFEAVRAAPAGAVVLIAGKGHEDYQLIGKSILPFDDRLVAREALAARRAEERG